MKNKTSSTTSQLIRVGGALAASAVLGVACQNTEPRELGYTQGDQDLRGEPSQPFFSDPQEFAGRWIGTADDPIGIGRDRDYVFPSGSRSFEVDVELGKSEFGGEALQATLIFGRGEPLPPPTDPDAGYPVGFNFLEALSYGEEAVSIPGTNPDLRLPPFEGFEYHAETLGAVDDGTLSLSDGLLILNFNVNEPFDPWCALQTPFESPTAPGLFQCVETFGGGADLLPDGSGASCNLQGPNDASACPENPSADELIECIQFGETVAVANCDKLFMCTNDVCQCDQGACYAGGSPDQLVLRREGDELVGVFAGTTFVNARNMKTPLGEIRLRRAD